MIYVEDLGHGEQRTFMVEETLYSGDTQFQHIEIIKASGYGRVLFLNGKRQSSEADEFIYHEALVQPVMFRHPDPKRVFILGGGEGAVAREVLRHKSVTHVRQVDIDGELIELCKEHLPQWHAGAFDDPRMELIIGDGLAYLQENDELYDVIILDLPEWASDTPAAALYERAFYELVSSRLADANGLIALQVGPVHPVHIEDYLEVGRRLKAVYPQHLFFSATELRWGFGIVAPEADLQAPPLLFDASRTTTALRYYNADLHTHLGALPTYLHDALTV